MKKILLLLLFVLTIGIFFYLRYVINRVQSTSLAGRQVNRLNKKQINISQTVKSKETTAEIKESIFVPYWSLTEDIKESNYDRYFYFGVTADSQGINPNETGYLNMEKFLDLTEGKKKYLVLRLLNDDFNKQLLLDKNLQGKIIEEITSIADENNFDGLALDLELFSLFNNDTSNQINDFVKDLYTLQKQYYKSLAIILYGDSFYRKRPFDLSFLSKNSDEILVMAYDFHKSQGEPGPNFPFDSGRQYNYSFKKMISDFNQIVPTNKLTVVFGMFGYDWTVDEKKRPFTQAKALTLGEIKKKYLNKCDRKDCLIKRDETSQETEINYTVSSDKPDDQGIYRIDYHIIWFEDEESVKVKKEYLQKQGIGSVSYWAWGYF